MRRRLVDYNQALKDSADPDSLEDDDLWELVKPDLSWALWKLGRRFDWHIPLFEGGLAEWPEWFMHDMAILEWLNRMVRRDLGMD